MYALLFDPKPPKQPSSTKLSVIAFVLGVYFMTKKISF